MGCGTCGGGGLRRTSSIAVFDKNKLLNEEIQKQRVEPFKLAGDDSGDLLVPIPKDIPKVR